MGLRKETSPDEAVRYFSGGWRAGRKGPSADDIARSLQRGLEEVDKRIERQEMARLAWLRDHPKGNMVVRT